MGKRMVEFKYNGNACNADCVYCYQDPMRRAGNTKTRGKANLDLMFQIADEQDAMITVFGGEGLLVPIPTLDQIFAHSFEKKGKASIQTNGSLIKDEHIEMFKKYNVHVGISVDGPGELNSLRLSKEKGRTTDEMTAATIQNIEKLKKAGVEVGIIICVHKMNGTKERLPQLFQFIRWLESIGIINGNIHLVEVDSEAAKDVVLSEEENTHAFVEMAKFFEENPQLQYSPFRDMKNMMLGKNPRSCIWSSCDPMNTQAVYGVEGNGAISNCGMVNKDGVEWHKAQDTNFMRDVILAEAPQESGGCKGCPFFLMCNGHCNGSAVGGDWRNRTVHCETIKSVFSFYEEAIAAQGMVPFSKHPRLRRMEQIYLEQILTKNDRWGIERLLSFINAQNPSTMEGGSVAEGVSAVRRVPVIQTGSAVRRVPVKISGGGGDASNG